MKEFIINKTNENQRLDKYLKRILPASSNSFLYKMLRKKNIELNGKRAKGDEILKSGDSIKIFFSDDTFSKMSDSVKENLNIFLDAYKNIKNVEIVFEHEDFMIVNKPEGVLTQKDKSSIPSLNEWCIGYLLSKNFIDEKSLKEFRPSVLNRLDRNTKGLVIFGKTLTGSQRLSELIKKRDIKKYYFAKTEGGCDLNGLYKAYLSKDEKTNKVTIYDDIKNIPKNIKYSPISTKINVLKSEKDYSLLEIELITGKSHQIRAHLAHLGYPLLGDKKYNGKTDSNLKYQELIAYKLVFPKFEYNDSWNSLSKKIIKINVDN
ncbi:MAG: RluA family pseudouridine synthase [Lachnospiraceae bacterium]|nr:RluA family pseudouridine synthase [Lachnospiraceae bacterium]